MPGSVAVTGGTGVVGAALVRHLITAGQYVVALARTEAGSRTLEEMGARPVLGDVLDSTSLDRLVAGAERVFHVAGINQLCPTDPGALWRVNVGGTRMIAEACLRAGVPRMVHTSSATTLGEQAGEMGDEETVRSRRYLSHYERSKTEAERVVLAGWGDLEVVTVNPSSVQGPGRATGSGRLLVQAARGRLRFAIDTVFSLVDIDDCARGHMLAGELGRPGERYLLSGATLSTRETLSALESVVGPLPRVRMVPPALSITGGVLGGLAGRALGLPVPLCPEAVRVMRHPHRFDGSKATRELGLEYTAVEETFRRTMDWFQEEGLI